jgi:hypothetical protein
MLLPGGSLQAHLRFSVLVSPERCFALFQSKSKPQPTCQAQPSLAFIPHAFNASILAGVQLLLPAWIRWVVGIRRINVDNTETLVDLYQQFQVGKARFLLAFRHPCTDDPFCMAYLLGHAVPRAARRQGIQLKTPVHSYFLYDRGIPLWAGEGIGWLFHKLGGSSIFRGKLDLLGLKAARGLLVNGEFPLAAAPEGATNDHSELVSPLEPGLAQIGFWAAEDLAAAARDETVYIVPISIQYRYEHPPWPALQTLMGELEQDLGLPPETWRGELSGQLYQRLLRLTDTALNTMETFYHKAYHQDFPELAATPELQSEFQSAPSPDNALRMARLQRLMETALQVAESYFGIKSKGGFSDRCRRLEQAAWDRIYREDLSKLSPLEKGLADWQAQEAQLRLGHMRWVERFTAITGDYIQSKPTAHRFAEVLLILHKVITTLKGGDANRTPNFGPRQVRMTIGTPISVTERFLNSGQDKRKARQAVTDLTQDLQQALQGMIVCEL